MTFVLMMIYLSIHTCMYNYNYNYNYTGVYFSVLRFALLHESGSPAALGPVIRGKHRGP